jgi:hypothetical protein
MVQRLIVLMTSLVPRENIRAVFKKRSGYSAPRTRTIRLWFWWLAVLSADRLGGAIKNGVGFRRHARGRKPRGLSGRLAHTSGPPPAS